jgi:serine/threonine protein kinase
MREVSDGQRELDFVRAYRASARKSEHILSHLAIIERDKEASVIYPLAESDLQKLLEGKSDSERYKWRKGDVKQFSDIVEKSYDLAEGLEFLHHGLHQGSDLSCRHGDLKPNNFLIFSNGWKISDMGLAKVKDTSNNETGIQKSTQTSMKPGCGAYAPPEMSKPETTSLGRASDVWPLAAIIMELMIWGLGGPSAWDKFTKDRKGLFHKNGVLSPVVDNELHSWPKVYLGPLSQLFHGNDEQAREFLRNLEKALRSAFEIDPGQRASSKVFLDSMSKVLKHFRPTKQDHKETQMVLQIRKSSSPKAVDFLEDKFTKHTRHSIFHASYFKPTEQIRISNDTESAIRKWMQQPIPSALCVLTGNHELISAITREVYYTARTMDFTVVKFLTLGRYDNNATKGLGASLDLVYCFIHQLLKYLELDPQKYELAKLPTRDLDVDPTTSNENFELALDVLSDVIKTQQEMTDSRPIIVIMDEFWNICPRMASEATQRQWRRLLELLGCTIRTANSGMKTSPPLASPIFKTLLRVNGWRSALHGLGFSGAVCIPSPTDHMPNNLRNTLKAALKC